VIVLAGLVALMLFFQRALTQRAASPPGQVGVVRTGFKNVPRLALSGAIAHDPGNCRPEAFFFESAP
jgi:hypothetical protein